MVFNSGYFQSILADYNDTLFMVTINFERKELIIQQWNIQNSHGYRTTTTCQTAQNCVSVFTGDIM